MKTRSLLWLVLLMPLVPRLVEPSALSQGVWWSAFPPVKFKASSIEWQERPSFWDVNVPVFSGRREGEPKRFYSLTLTYVPSFRCVVDETKAWLGKHPDAEATAVLDPKGAEGYVWVVDGEDSLNIHLVRRGCYSHGLMVLQEGYKTSLSQTEYEEFYRKLIAAQMAARVEKLGVWSKRED